MATNAQTLAEQQQAFKQAVVSPSPATPGLLRESPGREPMLRIYQHAYAERLVATLGDNFGVLPRAMGDEAFDTLARAYLHAHPSRHPSIRWFGDRLADFMQSNPELVPHPAFIDIARMEWGLRQAFDAADGVPLRPDALASLPPEAWPAWVPRFLPSAALLALDWHIEPAWRALKQQDDAAGGEEAELPEPQPGAHGLLVWRPRLETLWRSVTDPVEARLLPMALAGACFGELCEAAAGEVGEAQAAVAAVGVLQQWLADEVLQDGG
jgi:hypothetical protein